MNWPPMLMHVKVKNRDSDFGIWIPLVIVFLVALAVIIALSPFIILALIILMGMGLDYYARLTVMGIWMMFVTVWSTKGLQVDVQNFKERVSVSVI